MAIPNRRDNSMSVMESQLHYHVHKTTPMVPVTRWIVYSILCSLNPILLITSASPSRFPHESLTPSCFRPNFSYMSHDVISPTHLTRFHLIVLINLDEEYKLGNLSSVILFTLLILCHSYVQISPVQFC
jgi:hypothetical protein